MENNSLYLDLKNRLCEMIYRGIYKDGENIPPERTLAEQLNVSRVTVRKALELLEKDGIVERVQGSGTQIRLRQTGYKGSMDIIALVAPAQNPFFAAFIDEFQKNAEKYDTLVLFMQNPPEKKIEDSLFKLFQKNIRNVVVWLEDLELESDSIRRLRGLGMNMVFFDISVSTSYADCVLLDNEEAIKDLYGFLKNQGAKHLAYLGWDNLSLSSIKERENTFRSLEKEEKNLFHIPWKEKGQLLKYMKYFMSQQGQEILKRDAVICGDGELGAAFKKTLAGQGNQGLTVVCVDDSAETKELSMSVYSQLFSEHAQKVYECLLQQNKYAKKWKAAIYTVKGKLIRRPK